MGYTYVFTYVKYTTLIAYDVKRRWGEPAYDVRTASEEAWGVFLREFKHWCASKEVHEIARPLLARV
jgi:hypothetical protein